MTEAGAPYTDPTRPIPERVADLVSRMTPAEKVGQMLQLPTWSDPAPLIADYDLGSILHTDPSVIDAAIDAAAASRLGIPLLIADDCIRGHSFWPGATLFPSQLAQGCSWNVDLIEAAARATAAEVASTGIVWTFSPVLCIARDPRWGRVDETFGEDPLLIGELAAAMIRGYQGEGLDDPSAILACAKHFAGYSETQGGRDASEADVSRRKLRSWFLPPFERAVREGCRTFMLGYQSMDGVPVTLNEWLLSQVLKGEWGFTGLLVTDWDNVGRMVWEQKVSPDAADAAARAVAAGNDLIMSTADFRDGALEALADGRIDEAQLDEAVARILTVKFGLADMYARYPWIAYGTDWLAFGHITVALFFIGPLVRPAESRANLLAGMAACLLVIPLALVCGAIRGIPFYWRLIDCSFGVFGIIPLLVCLRLLRHIAPGRAVA